MLILLYFYVKEMDKQGSEDWYEYQQGASKNHVTGNQDQADLMNKNQIKKNGINMNWIRFFLSNFHLLSSLPLRRYDH